VNSLRARLPHVINWLREVSPDILALQEIKLQDIQFPHDAIREAGYQALVSGQKAYNGVAIFFKNIILNEVITDIPELNDHSRRLLGATINNQIRILNLYVPNGEHISSEKYQYKLNWLQKFDQFLKNELEKYPYLIILGDFNIAPEEIDVHDPTLFAGQVLFSELEREAYRSLLQKGFNDCFRHFNPTDKSFTWWDYRLNAFKRNLGVRIDHILASQAFMSSCKKCYIDKIPREWERPSDHTPVIAEFHIAHA
jgi:exodeoxyribonuclease III